MSRLLLVRHATSLAPTIDGPNEYDRPLSAAGLAQADELATALVAERPTRILSSPYLRAVQTVLPAAKALDLGVERREELREWLSGIGPKPDWQSHYRRCWECPDACVPGGERQVALEQRAVTAVRQVAQQSGDNELTVVASHGTWIARALHGLGVKVDADFWFAMPMPAVYMLSVQGANVAVIGPGLPPV